MQTVPLAVGSLDSIACTSTLRCLAVSQDALGGQAKAVGTANGGRTWKLRRLPRAANAAVPGLACVGNPAGLRSTESPVLSGAMQRARAAHRTGRLAHPQRGRGDLRIPARPDRGALGDGGGESQHDLDTADQQSPAANVDARTARASGRDGGLHARAAVTRGTGLAVEERSNATTSRMHLRDHVYLALSCPTASTTVAVRPDQGARARPGACGAAEPHPEVIGASRTPSVRAHLLVSGDWGSFHCPTVRLRPIRHRPSSRLAPRTTLRTRSFRRRRRP